MSRTVGIAFFGAPAAGPPPPPPTPMDTYLTGMVTAYGLKQVLSAYTGPLVRVRRSSDNAEQDIGFVSGTGVIDTTALAAFVGSDSAFVTKWYDQKLTVDAVQTTTTKQPKIVNAGTYLGLLQFDGVDDYLISNTPSVQCLSFAGFIHLPAAPGSGSASYFAHSGVGTVGNNGLTCQYQSNNTSTNSYIFTSNNNYSHQPATFSTVFTSMILVANRGHYPPTYYADGAARGGSSDTLGTPTNANYTAQDLYIGSDGNLQPAAITTSEFIIWTIDQAAAFFGIFGAL